LVSCGRQSGESKAAVYVRFVCESFAGGGSKRDVYPSKRSVGTIDGRKDVGPRYDGGRQAMQAAEVFDFRVVFIVRVACLAAMVGRENAVVVASVDKVALPFVKEEVARVVLVTTGSQKFVDVEACGFLGLNAEPFFLYGENDRHFIRIHPVLVTEGNR
jgi:hypothetical protein